MSMVKRGKFRGDASSGIHDSMVNIKRIMVQKEASNLNDGTLSGSEISEESEEETLVTSEARTRISTKDAFSFSSLSYMLCIRTATLRYRSSIIPERFEKADFLNVDYYYALPIGAIFEVRIKEYAPLVFESLRRISIDIGAYMSSWSMQPSSQQSTEGKSGSKFIYSGDKRYLIKTISFQESRWLTKILPAYYQFLQENPSSLLVRYLGLYKISEGKKISYCTVIENVFDTQLCIDEIYDLKGSSAGRSRRQRKNATSSSPLLDKDLTRTLFMKSDVKKQFIEQLQKDSEFLCSQNLMDYSLLLGIAKKEVKKEEENPETKNGNIPGMVYFTRLRRKELKKLPRGRETNKPDAVPSRSCMKRSKYDRKVVDKEVSEQLSEELRCLRTVAGKDSELYSFGVIDFLQKFDSKKKLAGFAKSFVSSGEEVSTVNPRKYSARFTKFIESIIVDDV